jgi:nucleoside 2-deoxyribosyltransferase
MLSSIYLTGGIYDSQTVNGGPDSEWRSSAMSQLQRYGLRVINPLEFAWTNEDLPLGEVQDSKVRRALDLIDQSDAILANLNRSDYGTPMEIFYAHTHGKVVTVVGQSPFSPWVLSHSRARFADLQKALDYIIEEQWQSHPLNWALQYEALLAERYEQLPPSGEADYKFIGGELPILVVAPHATAFWKDGEFQESDAYTGSMAALLNRSSSCHALISNYCSVADPFFYLETPFCRALADIVKTGQIGLVLFLLGAPWHKSPGLQIYRHPLSTEYGNLLRLKLMPLEPVSMSSVEDKDGPLFMFANNDLAVPTIALKMHKRYRMPRMQPDTFSLFQKALSEFVLEVGLQLSRAHS